MDSYDEKSGRSKILIEAYEKLNREVLFGDIPLSPDDLSILKEVRRSLMVFCPKWYNSTAYRKQVIDPLIRHLVAIGYRAARYEVKDKDGDGEQDGETDADLSGGHFDAENG